MNQRIALTKSLLKNALIEMLQTQSVYEISVRDLCLQAGINRSTFYKHYGSQIDLLNEMEQDLITDIESYLDKDAEPTPEALVQVFRYLEKNLDFVRLLLSANVDKDLETKIFSLTPIKRMMEAADAPGISREAAEYAYRYRIAGAYKVVCLWVEKPDRETPEWMARYLLELIGN